MSSEKKEVNKDDKKENKPELCFFKNSNKK